MRQVPRFQKGGRNESGGPAILDGCCAVQRTEVSTLAAMNLYNFLSDAACMGALFVMNILVLGSIIGIRCCEDKHLLRSG